jgi:hypothetical protein
MVTLLVSEVETLRQTLKNAGPNPAALNNEPAV